MLKQMLLRKMRIKFLEIISRKNDRNWPEPIESDYVVSVASLPKIFKVDSKEKIPKDPYVFASNKPKPDFYFVWLFIVLFGLVLFRHALSSLVTSMSLHGSFFGLCLVLCCLVLCCLVVGSV